MSANVRILFNPACSKCRLSKELLETRGENIEVVEYLTAPPPREELEQILAMLGLEPRQLMRQNEAAYTELALDRPELSRDELINAMLAQPILIERPIVIKNGKARIGRPPEQILDIL
jgi:arsenate reductase